LWFKGTGIGGSGFNNAFAKLLNRGKYRVMPNRFRKSCKVGVKTNTKARSMLQLKGKAVLIEIHSGHCGTGRKKARLRAWPFCLGLQQNKTLGS
jgi:hypothetical protein